MPKGKKPERKSAVNGKPAAKTVSSTPVRNSPIPKTAKAPAAAVPAAKAAASSPSKAAASIDVPPAKTTKSAATIPTYEQIAKRAYEIHLSGSGGSEMDNWLRAERELRGN